MQRRIDCIVLGGGEWVEIGGKMFPKPLVPIGGKPMVAYIVDALDHSEVVARKVLVADAAAHPISSRFDGVARPGASLDGSIANGLAVLPVPTTWVLLVSSDIPLIRGDMVHAFVLEALLSEATLAAPIIERDLYEQRFPGSKRHYLSVKGGKAYKLGNMFMVNPGGLDAHAMELIHMAGDLKKNILKLALRFGLIMAARVVLGRAEIFQVEAAVSRMIGMKALSVELPFPELAYDVDTAEQAAEIERLLAV